VAAFVSFWRFRLQLLERGVDHRHVKAEQLLPWAMTKSTEDVGQLHSGKEQTLSLRLKLSRFSTDKFLKS